MKADAQIEAEVAQVLARFLRALGERNSDAFVTLFAKDPDVFLFGTGQDETRIGRQAICEQIKRDFEQSESGSYDLLWWTGSSSGSVVWIAGEAAGRIIVGGNQLVLPNFRFTAVLERREPGWQFLQLHWSFPAVTQAEGESWPSSLDEILSAVSQERMNLNDRASLDGTVTLLFSDIEASTPMAERVGDLRWIELLREHNAMVREQVAHYGGFEVKTIGDAFMVAFSSARAALQCAIGMQKAAAAYCSAHPDQPLRIRIGLHSGEPVRDGNDFYGKCVMLASRIASQARGGEILVSALLHDLVESGGDFRFDDGHESALKGLAGTYTIYQVILDDEDNLHTAAERGAA